MKEYISKVFQDERGVPSHKRILAVIITLSLIVAMFITLKYGKTYTVPDSIVQALAFIAGICIGGSVADKFSLKNIPPILQKYIKVEPDGSSQAAETSQPA